MIPTPTLALHTSRCGKRLVLLAALTGLTAFLSSSVAEAQPPLIRAGTVRVMTQNMYMGNPGTIVSATPETLAAAVAKFFNESVASNPAQRAAAIAKKIHDNRPDLVALQEVSILRRGTGNDPTIAATQVVHDQLQLLRDALTELNEHYETVAVIPNSDVQFRSTLGHVVRVTDRNAILVRTSSALKLSNVQVEEYWAEPDDSPFRTHGWGSVDVEVFNRKFRFVATHLLAPRTLAHLGIQRAQASELIQSAGKTDLPVVYAGDFNVGADVQTPANPTFPTYQILVNGRVDAWAQKHPMDNGFTCCHPDIHSTSNLIHRVDLVIVPPNTVIEEVKLVGADPADFTGLWPSDHAGVVAMLTVPRNVGGRLFFYNSQTRAAASGELDALGAFINLKDFAAGQFGTWTHIVSVSGRLFFYNQETRAAASGELNAAGDFITLKDFAAGQFGIWTLIAG